MWSNERGACEQRAGAAADRQETRPENRAGGRGHTKVTIAGTGFVGDRHRGLRRHPGTEVKVGQLGQPHGPLAGRKRGSGASPCTPKPAPAPAPRRPPSSTRRPKAKKAERPAPENKRRGASRPLTPRLGGQGSEAGGRAISGSPETSSFASPPHDGFAFFSSVCPCCQSNMRPARAPVKPTRRSFEGAGRARWARRRGRARSARRGRARASPAHRRRRARCVSSLAARRRAPPRRSCSAGHRAVDDVVLGAVGVRIAPARRRVFGHPDAARAGACGVAAGQRQRAPLGALARPPARGLRGRPDGAAARRGTAPRWRSTASSCPAILILPRATSSHASGASSKPIPCIQIQRSACSEPQLWPTIPRQPSSSRRRPPASSSAPSKTASGAGLVSLVRGSRVRYSHSRGRWRSSGARGAKAQLPARRPAASPCARPGRSSSARSPGARPRSSLPAARELGAW